LDFSTLFREIQPESISALAERLFNLEPRIVSLSDANQKRRFRPLEEHFLVDERHIETLLPGLHSLEVEVKVDSHRATNERKLCIFASRATDLESFTSDCQIKSPRDRPEIKVDTVTK
jgi:hypothetical protein